MKKLFILCSMTLYSSSIISMGKPLRSNIPVHYHEATQELTTLDNLIIQAQTRATQHKLPTGYVGIPTNAGHWITQLADSAATIALAIRTALATSAQQNRRILRGSAELDALKTQVSKFIEFYNGIFKINLEGIPQSATALYDQIVAQLNKVIGAIELS